VKTRTSDAPEVDQALRSGVRKAGWRLLPLLGAGYLISYIDRTNVGFAALTMNEALALTATQFGFAAGIFYLGYVSMEVPSSLVLRRVGARRWLARIMITWGLAAAGTAFVVGPQSLYVIRLLTGVAEAGFYPGVIFYLSTWFPPQYRARVFAVFSMANPLSSVVSGPVSTSLLEDMDGLLGLAGWQWMFICEGLPACVLGLWTLRCLPDSPDDARWLTAEEKAALSAPHAEPVRPGVSTDLWQALRDPRITILSISYFLLIVGILGVTLWLPQMLKQHSLSTTAIGWVSTVPYLAACIGMIVWSVVMDRTRAFLNHYVVACLVAAGGFALSITVDSLPITLMGITLALVGMNACRAPLFAMCPTFVAGAAAAGSIAFINSVGNLGGFVGPYLVGWLKDTTGSFSAGLVALAIALAAAGFTALLLKIVRPHPSGLPSSLHPR
jgi:sugar phosphate permease